MNYRELRRKALDLNVELRAAYRAAGIDRTIHYRHSHRMEQPSPDMAERILQAILLLADLNQKHRHPHWPRKMLPHLIRLRHARGMSAGEVEDRVGTADCLCAKWEAEMKLPSIFMLLCWGEALDAQMRPIPNELVTQVDRMLEDFYAQASQAQRLG